MFFNLFKVILLISNVIILIMERNIVCNIRIDVSLILVCLLIFLDGIISITFLVIKNKKLIMIPRKILGVLFILLLTFCLYQIAQLSYCKLISPLKYYLLISVTVLLFFYISFFYVNLRNDLTNILENEHQYLTNERQHLLSGRKCQINKIETIILLEDKNDDCSICLVKFEVNGKYKKLTCNHYYHNECIEIWLLENNTCPICKTVIIKDEV